MAERRPGQHHHLQSFADTFICPLSQLAPPTRPQSPESPPGKAKRRRKRHVPPGPAGVWFQSQLHNNNNNTESTSTQRKQQEVAAPDVSSCPAWMCMQHSLKLCTPYLPPYLSIRQRYEELRPCIPSEFLLLFELKGASFVILKNKKLLVQVHAAVVQYHSYWTVELRDECGSTISAWMDPEFDEEQDGGLLQIGVVWCLRDLRMLVSSETKQQWLLITRENIERAWTPLEAAKEFSDAQYIEWMTRRSHVRRSSEDGQPRRFQALEEDYEQEQQQRQTRVQQEEEEEEDDDAVIPRDFASRVVTPHPSISNRKHNKPTVSQLNPCLLQEKDTEPSSVNSRLTLQEPKDTPCRRKVANSERGEPVNRPAVTANMFSQFQSPSSQIAPVSDAAPLRHRDQVRSTPAAAVIPRATTASSSQSEERQVPRNESPSDPPSSQHCPTGSRNATGRVVPVAHAPPEPGSARSVSVFSQFSAMRAAEGGDDVFSQFRPPTSAGAEPHIVQAVSTTSNPYQRKRMEERPRRISLDGSERPIQTASSSAPGTVQNRPGLEVAERSSLIANAKSKSSAPSVSSNISDVLSQFAAVPAGKKMGGTKSPVVSAANTKGTSPKVITNRRTPQSEKEKNRSEQHQTKKKRQMSPKPNSPKLPSKLWLDADMSMMGMFDEDGHDKVCSPTLTTALPRTTNLPQDEDAPDAEPSNPKASSSLFEASSFAGISVDDLFNEEDDETL